MQIVFLDAGTMGDTSLAEIAALGTLTVYNDTSREDSLLRAADADVAIVNKVIVDDTFLDHAPKLRLVCEA
ncbi:MAG: hydroxyacid dehydrogenase, partial [Bacteroidales bacterium]|nr:hydroxyacid dehydrogenase [Bacteroidales bacterium]